MSSIIMECHNACIRGALYYDGRHDLEENTFCCFFCAQKLFLQFCKITVEPLIHFSCIAVYVESESSQNVIINILICVLNMNEGLMALERHEGEWLMTGGNDPFKSFCFLSYCILI